MIVVTVLFSVALVAVGIAWALLIERGPHPTGNPEDEL